MNIEPIIEFERKITRCYKGLEINLSHGSAFDKEIKHGISQLQYGLPRLITEQIINNAKKEDRDSAKPFFIIPILVTTAELRIINKNATLEEVENTDSLESISQKVPYLILYESFGPEFVDHSKLQFERLVKLKDEESINRIDMILKSNTDCVYDYGPFTDYDLSSPKHLIKNLSECKRTELDRFCTHFFICSIYELQNLLDGIKRVIGVCLKTKRQLKN